MALRFNGILAGAVAIATAWLAGSAEVTTAAGDSRTISLYNIHTKETLTVLYKKDGIFVPAAMKRINTLMRDWRANEETEMDPQLIDTIWEMHIELGSREPIHVISGFRSQKTNNNLREGGGGQAKNSRHILGKAADVHFPDVPVRQLRYSALIKERGGVGYYPTSAIPFVHVDTDRVRHWPSMPRYELALLFPSGHSKHVPSDGRPISKEDVRVAQAQHKELAVQIAQFFEVRGKPDLQRTVIAALTPPKPEPAPAPQPVQQRRMALLPPQTTLSLAPQAETEPEPPVQPPPRLAAVPVPILAARPQPQPKKSDTLGALMTRELASLASTEAKAPPKPTRIAALDPKTAPRPATKPAEPPKVSEDTLRSWGNGFQTAPAFDDEHPEELSYRPFAIGPILTEDMGLDHPVLAATHHPDTRRIFDLLDEPERLFPLSFRPGKQVAELLWADQFLGDKVGVKTLMGEAAVPQAQPGVKQRKVATSVQ